MTALKIFLGLSVVTLALSYGTLRHAPLWKDQAVARLTISPVGSAPRPAAKSGKEPHVAPIGGGLRPPPKKLMPIDNSSLRRAGRLSEVEALPPAAETADDTALRSTLLHRPVALDSGRFRVGAGTIQLEGIIPLRPNAMCGAGSGAWPCGARARTALRALVGSRSITCTVPGNFGKAKAEIDSACSLGALDLAEWLVENGWARAKSDGHYAAIEAKARDARKGVWAIAGAASLGDDAPVNPTPSPDDLPAPPQ